MFSSYTTTEVARVRKWYLGLIVQIIVVFICLPMMCANDTVLGGHDESENGCYETVDCY